MIYVDDPAGCQLVRFYGNTNCLSLICENAEFHVIYNRSTRNGIELTVLFRGINFSICILL